MTPHTTAQMASTRPHPSSPSAFSLRLSVGPEHRMTVRSDACIDAAATAEPSGVAEPPTHCQSTGSGTTPVPSSRPIPRPSARIPLPYTVVTGGQLAPGAGAVAVFRVGSSVAAGAVHAAQVAVKPAGAESAVNQHFGPHDDGGVPLRNGIATGRGRHRSRCGGRGGPWQIHGAKGDHPEKY